MSKEDLWRVVGRARCDLDFGGKLNQDFDQSVLDAGYQLDPDELADARNAVERQFFAAPAGNAPVSPQSAQLGPAEQAQLVKMKMEQFERFDQFNAYMLETVKETFNYASVTFKTITWMNWLTFGTGIALFAFSAVYAMYAPSKQYSLLFAGLGVSSFVTSFVLRTPEKTQAALSNLVKTEIAFLNYFDQQCFWEGYANIPRNGTQTPDPANLEKASAGLMDRARETLELLDRFVAAAAQPADASSAPTGTPSLAHLPETTPPRIVGASR
jgi:hypothetical protein